MTLARCITNELIKVNRLAGWRAEREVLFSPRRIDVLAISAKGLDVVAFEIKVSRQDFRNELKDHDKRRTVSRNCTQFYFVAPRTIIQPFELPDGCGLIEFADGAFSITVHAPAYGTDLAFETVAKWRRRDEEALRQQEWEEQQEASAPQAFDDLPQWMAPQYNRQPRFQLDVTEVAKLMASVWIPFLEIDFDRVPF